MEGYYVVSCGADFGCFTLRMFRVFDMLMRCCVVECGVNVVYCGESLLVRYKGMYGDERGFRYGLRELVDAGVVTRRSRGVYEINVKYGFKGRIGR